ncbi:NADP-dependent oxidoreductase [Paenibacillus sacheonensis]|uniref:Zinc-binding dehydrogenase n=2 Tax=Paenibacillus sacheonensis TaxID=742054 RepID=A0A7X4YJT8_9BACL|nr:NADP-dependent oxidoreductase [Paenibacillus sacheonensis]NBC67685.1 zinc-binding dehydrogenase [Paenibacillus sacheonensis]
MIEPVMQTVVRYHQFGGSDVLRFERIPLPRPLEGEVLVRVVSAGVLPVDWKIRKGSFPMPVQFPAIPGTAFSGVVEGTGPGVTAFQKGQEVFGRSAKGTYAAFTTAAVDAIALKPESVGFDEAAAISGGATTAWRAIESAGVKAGDRVLIHGAAGGVGLFAVQFAKCKGAQVIGTAGPANIDFVRSLGVDVAVDYMAEPFEHAAQDVDFVLDTIGGETLERSWPVIKRGGTLITITGKPPVERGMEFGIRVLPSSLATREDLAAIADLMDEGRVKAVVQHAYPLSEVRQAHERSEQGHGRGRIVLRIES